MQGALAVGTINGFYDAEIPWRWISASRWTPNASGQRWGGAKLKTVRGTQVKGQTDRVGCGAMDIAGPTKTLAGEGWVQKNRLSILPGYVCLARVSSN
jgi:hypothetical protein